MTTLQNSSPKTVRLDRQELLKLAEEIDAQSGIVRDPQMSIAKLRELMKADGVRAEDNGASQELMQMRYGDNVSGQTTLWTSGANGTTYSPY